MIKTKRLLHLSLFLLLITIVSLFGYQQVMRKAINHLNTVEQHYPQYKIDGLELSIQEMYADIVEDVALHGYRIKDMEVSERAKKKLVSYRILSRTIKDMKRYLEDNYQSQTVFTLLDNQEFIHHYEEMNPLYDQVNQYQQILQKLCFDSLQFEMPLREAFVSRFNDVPLAITKNELILLDQFIALEASKAIEYEAQKLGTCIPMFPRDTCAIVNPRIIQ